MLASVYFCILYQVKDHVTNAVIIVLKYMALYILLQVLFQIKINGGGWLRLQVGFFIYHEHYHSKQTYSGVLQKIVGLICIIRI